MAAASIDRDADLTTVLAERIAHAAAEGAPLRVVGGDTKAFYGRPVAGAPLPLAGHRGIVAYEPSELVITARAGTPLVEIEAQLAERRQRLGFEPPLFGQGGTIGGAVAAGLSGQRRPFAGAVRDFVLGVVILDGRGRRLRFGGTVFKNVAGFDAFRLMAGALGSLGVILEVSLRLLPLPRQEAAVALELGSAAARDWLTDQLRRPTPTSGAFHDGERLHLRLSGGEAGVAAALAEIGGEAEPLSFWDELRGPRHPAAGEAPIWRLSLPRTTPAPEVGEVVCWDWAGAQIWLRSDRPSEAIWRAAAEAGGHATHFRGASAGEAVFQPLPPALFALHRRLKAALDPAGVLNPGRLYPEL